MRAFIRWLAAEQIADARIAAFKDGLAAAARVIRRRANAETPDRDRERNVLIAVAEGIEDVVGDTP